MGDIEENEVEDLNAEEAFDIEAYLKFKEQLEREEEHKQ